MKFRPFKTIEELDAYFNHDELTCFECGKPYQHLGRHVLKHKLTSNEYRDKWGIPRARGLAGKRYRDFHRKKINRLFKSKALKVDKKRLLNNVTSVDYSKRAPMKLASMNAANAKNPFRTYYNEPVVRNAVHKNLHRRSEYMAAYWQLTRYGDSTKMDAYKKKYGPRFKKK